MKISGRAQISAFLRAPQSGFKGALVYGPNYGLVCAIVNRTKESSGHEVRYFSYSDIKKEADTLIRAMSEITLFCPSCLIIVRDIGNSDSMSKSLQDALENSAKQNHVVFVGGQLESKSSLRGFFEKSKQYAALACYEDEPEVTAGVIKQWAQKHCPDWQGQSLAPLLQRFSGLDRVFIASELEKASLFFADNPENMTVNNVAAILDSATQDKECLNKLCTAMLDGNIDHTNITFKDAIALNDCGMIARSISRHVYRVMLALRHVKSGLGYGDAINKLSPPVFFKAKGDFMRQMRTLSATSNPSNIVARLVEYESARSEQHPDIHATVLLNVLLDCARSLNSSTAGHLA